MQWLLPLTIAAAGHGVVNADREQGTGRLIASTTSTPKRVLVARFLWPTAIVTLITTVAGTTAVLLAAPISGSDAWLRLPACCGPVVGYALFWALAVGSVTARASTPSMSLTSVGLLWIVLTWIAPGVLGAVVAASAPPPNRVDAHVAAREIERDLEPRLPSTLEAIYARRTEWRPSLLRPRPCRRSGLARQPQGLCACARGCRSGTPFARALGDRRERTERLVRQWSPLSPALAVQSLADHLAGTSAERFILFEWHAAAMERTWHAFTYTCS